MKKISIYILLFMGVALASCNNNTYSNALKEEQKLIENFIARQGIKVVTEKPTEWGDKVYWKVPDKDNYYFHLVEMGDTTKPALEAKDKVNLRYIQYTLDAYADTTRFWNSEDQPKPTELQYLVYTESTCEGWQIALEHMQYTGAQCKIICPSKLGFTNQNSNVIPYGYDMKIQIKRF
ncbi:MAG: DUF4827 family protein [Paludibacteraceae bacterium]|nr:DUF4827 family protein [Paludibacteraceae bacterium]